MDLTGLHLNLDNIEPRNRPATIFLEDHLFQGVIRHCIPPNLHVGRSKSKPRSKTVSVTASPSPESRVDTEQLRGTFEGLDIRMGGNLKVNVLDEVTQFDAKEMESGEGKQAFEYYLSAVLGA